MSSTAKVNAIYSGKIQKLPFKKIEIETAIFKEEVTSPIYVNKLGLESDEQGDKKYHGGPEQALCVYLTDSYTFWSTYKEHNIKSGCFGENLEISYLKEDSVYIGDTYSIGEVIVQVSHPRQPCSTLGFRNNWPKMVVISRDCQLTGFYLRVLKEGYIKPSDEVRLISRPAHTLSIKNINRILYEQHVTKEELDFAIVIEELGLSFKKDLQKKLNKLTINEA